MPAWERYFDLKHPKCRYLRLRFDMFVERLRGEKLLDVGCEGGLGIYLAAKKSDMKIFCGLDINKREIILAKERLRELSKSKDVSFVIASVEELPLKDNFFDCVICGEILEHVQDDKKSVNEIYRVTKSGGTLLVSVPDEGHLSKKHIRLYNKKSIESLIRSVGFSILESGRIQESDKGFWIFLAGVKNT